MSRMLRRSTRREIFSSFGRFFAVFAIIAIGVGFFSGLGVARNAMIRTGEEYLNDHKFYDLRILSPFGANADEIKSIATIEGVISAKGAFVKDALCVVEGKEELVYRIHSLTEGINTPRLVAGNMPKSSSECLLDAQIYGEEMIGKKIQITQSNTKDTLSSFTVTEMTVTGIITSPYYLNFERGTTNLGGGTLMAFIYVPENSFAFEDGLYDEILVDADISGALYSDEYEDGLDKIKERLADKLGSVFAARIAEYRAEAGEQIAGKEAELAQRSQELELGKATIISALEEIKKSLDARLAEFDELNNDVDLRIAELRKTVSSLSEAIAVIEARLLVAESEAEKLELNYNLTKNRYLLDEAQTKLTAAETFVSQKDTIKNKLDSDYKEYEKNLSLAKEGIAKAERELKEAQREIAEIRQNLAVDPDWNAVTLTRLLNTGYICFESDTQIVNGIAKVFPVFFFLVSALVCMTTMTRMVEEQRTQIGVLKALGNKNSEIRAKYITYSGLAATLGCAAGFAAGTVGLPFVVWKIYTMMYNFSDTVIYVFSPVHLAISLAAALLCSIGVTCICLRRSFRADPAEMMRPASPGNGGRIALEKIGFLWKRFPFLWKVTARNIFRYKKRMLMMIVGIAGCTSLIIAGFGMNDSVCNVVDDQFDSITVYDMSVYLSSPYENEESFRKDFSEASADIESFLPVMQFSSEIIADNIAKSTTVVVSSSPHFDDFFALRDAETVVKMPESGDVLISKGLARSLKISVGEKVTFSDADGNKMDFRVAGLFDNYFGNYVVLSEESLKDAGGSYSDNTVLICAKEGADATKLTAKLSSSPAALSVISNVELKDRLDSMLGNMNYLVIVAIICAGALAFVVIYNLTNINITERVREIATLKVLGFYRKECYRYIFRESNILTFLGSLVGVPLGILLHAYCMDQIQVDMAFFENRISHWSYLVAVVLTVAFALIINLFMRKKIASVDMAGSLKSIE